MSFTVWRRLVMVGVLALSLAVLPLAVPIDAQLRDTRTTDMRAADTDEHDFPWGVLGVLGLLGLAGLKCRPAGVERRSADDPARLP